MLGYLIAGRGEVNDMPEERQKTKMDSATTFNVNGPITGAVTVARAFAGCSQALMTASNPAANAAAAAVPSFVTVRFGGDRK